MRLGESPRMSPDIDQRDLALPRNVPIIIKLRQVDAVYENGVLRPLQPLDLYVSPGLAN
jgi:hypothetical protein